MTRSGVTALAVVALVVAALLAGCSSAAPDVAALLPPATGDPACGALTARLPAAVDGRPARGTGRWGSGRHAAALVCGVSRPTALTRDAQLFEVDDVAWLPERLDGATRWTAVDHRPYVALVLGSGVATDRALTAVSPALAATLVRSPLTTR